MNAPSLGFAVAPLSSAIGGVVALRPSRHSIEGEKQ